MYQPTLSRKFKLRRFHMEIDRKNGAILMSMFPEQIEKHKYFLKITYFFKVIFLKKVFLQMHPSYCSGRGSGRCRCHKKYNNQDSIKVINR